MFEYGVQEREIHLPEMFEYTRRAGFDDVLAVPHYVPGIAMTSAQLDTAMASPADEWLVMNEGRPIHLASYVIQSMFEHPILVSRKGRSTADSTMPRTLRAGIDPRIRRDCARVSGTVTVHNAGDTTWLCGDSTGRVRVGVQLMSPDRKLLALDFARAPLPHSLPPDQSADVPIALTLPDGMTPYLLKIDLVDEGICWFEDVGSRPIHLAV